MEELYNQCQYRERTAKDLCFNCDDKYFLGHRCKGKLFRLDTEQDCLIEVVYCDSEQIESREEKGGDIAINMHALSGSFNPRTIRLLGMIQGQQLLVLIDSGSSSVRITYYKRIRSTHLSVHSFKFCINLCFLF